MKHTIRSGRSGFLLTVAAALVLFAGCGGERGGTAAGPSAGSSASQAAAADAEWAWLQQAKKNLDAARQEKKAEETAALGEELDRRLVDFINASPLPEGEKPSGRFLAALWMKSDEDIRLAHRFIEQAGDYRRAIEIYEAARAVDPDNPQLAQELASARAHRYMTVERFLNVKKGMTQDEVRTLLGQPNLRDVRDFPERGITAWFYTKDAEGKAAAVWFAKEKGVPTVYMADFAAIETPRAPSKSSPSGLTPWPPLPSPSPRPGEGEKNGSFFGHGRRRPSPGGWEGDGRGDGGEAAFRQGRRL
jgi:outer membrane protein assembly factor BamE (lipoprotein component of BamABCDE complex)